MDNNKVIMREKDGKCETILTLTPEAAKTFLPAFKLLAANPLVKAEMTKNVTSVEMKLLLPMESAKAIKRLIVSTIVKYEERKN